MSWKPRKIVSVPARSKSIPSDNIRDTQAWLQSQAVQYGLVWLLAHAHDGVIWGKMENGKLIASHEAAQGHLEAQGYCPPLRLATLQYVLHFQPTEVERLLSPAEITLCRGCKVTV